MNGGVPSKELDENLLNILDQLASNSNLLDNPNNIQHICFLLGAGANPNVQGQDGKTLLHYLDKKLSDILDQLASNSNLLDDSNYIRYIMLLLGARADPNVQNQDGRTLSYYLDEKLLNILNQLAIDSNLLDDSNSIQYIGFLLGAGANPNIQNKAGKTLLHYFAERNDTDGIGFLLKAGADPSVQDHSGKTPFEYATKDECRQALKGLGCSSNDETTYTKLSDSDSDKDQGYYSDGSCENKGSPAKSPDNGNRTFTDQQTSSGRPVVSDSSDSDRDSEDSSDCGDDDIDHYDTSCGTRHSHLRYDENINVIKKKDSFSLAKIKLNAIEIERHESVWQKIYKIHNDLDKTCYKDEDYYKKCEEEFNEVISQALKQGVMFTFPYKNDESFVDLMISTLQKLFLSYDTTRIPEFIERTKISHIISGGATLNEFTQENHDDFVNIICKDEDILSQRDKNILGLNSLAHESIVNKSKQTHEYDFKTEIDNGHFCIEYPQDSIIEPAKILNNEEAKGLNLKVSILQVGESIVRVEKDAKGKRNYTDVLNGSIGMFFITEVGEISICLYCSKENSNEIKVEFTDKESKARFDKLGDEKKKSLGENCLLGGENVLKVIEDKGFERNKDVPSTDLTQTSSFAAIDTRAKSKYSIF